jgi:hypothetical protein
MRRRLTLLSSLVALMLVLALPGTTLAASYTYTIQQNTCTASGGKFGYGQVNFTVKMTEYSKSANKFTFTGKGQHRNIGSSRWTNEYNFGTFTYRFEDNAISHWYSRYFRYSPADGAWHRIKVVLKVWHGGVLLAYKTVYSRSC